MILIKSATAREYIPVLSEAQRLSYQAAHKLLSADTRVTEFGTPGKQRSVLVDRYAAIIHQVFAGEALEETSR